MNKRENKIEISFEYGPKVEVKGNIAKNYIVEFINGFNGKVEYKDSIKNNLYSMGTLCEAKEDLKNDYFSIIHTDNTCRAQVIDNENSFIFKFVIF